MVHPFLKLPYVPLRSGLRRPHLTVLDHQQRDKADHGNHR
jgi:hypothetical protein